MDYKKVYSYFKKIFDLNNQLEKNEEGGFEGKNVEIFEELISLREDILDLFGLPYTESNIYILDNVKKDTDIEKAIEKLKAIAIDYLLSSPDSDEKLLTYVKENQLNSYSVLAELKMPIHIYTSFICDVILKKEKTSIQSVLDELCIIKNNEESDLLNDIGIISQNPNEYKTHSKYPNIKKHNLKYFETYMEYLISEKK